MRGSASRFRYGHMGWRRRATKRHDDNDFGIAVRPAPPSRHKMPLVGGSNGCRREWFRAAHDFDGIDLTL